MNDLSKRDEKLPNSYRVISISVVGDYIFVETSKTSLIIDKDKNVYDVGKYKRLNDVYQMGNDLFAVLEGNFKQDLVNMRTKEVYLSQRNSYYSGIWQVDDDYVKLGGPDYNKKVFNIRTKKFIEPEVDIPVDFSRKVGPNLFVYENNDYHNQIYQHFLINQDGKLVYNCGSYFPYFTDGNLILSLLKEGEVAIVRDVCNNPQSIEMISQNEMVSSNPLIYTNEKHEADSICFVSGKDFTMVDLNMNVIKKYPLDIDYDSVEIQLWGDMAVIIVNKGDDSYCIGLNIKNGVQMKHHGIWILPLDVKGPVVVRGCDCLGDDQYMFTLYDENGNEYVRHQAKDCFNVHCRKMNLIKFYDVDGANKVLVYNVDTREEKEIPWVNPEFKVGGDGEYKTVGYGIRYGETWQDEIIDLFDEDMNVVYEGIVSKDYGIRGEDFSYSLVNNLLLLTIPISRGPATYYRKVVLDREKNKLYDTFDNRLSFVGNYLQIIDDENDKTYYIDSRTGKTVEDAQITMQDIALPDTLNVNGEVIKLVKQNEDVSSE